MSLLDNIKGRTGDEGEPGGKFNPFRLLEIGEIMVRYTDGIRIKDFVFLAVLTSERLILIDSARQGTGQITKEIPFSVIKQADLERDERDRPALAISMEVAGQQRVMRLVFTGLINDPDSECREWYTAINGYPPERVDAIGSHLDEPAAPAPVEQKPPSPALAPVIEAPPAYVEPSVPQAAPSSPVRPEPDRPVRRPVPEPVPPAPVPVPAIEPVYTPPVQEPVPEPEPPVAPAPPARQPAQQVAARVSVAPMPEPPRSRSDNRELLKKIPVSEGSIRIVIEKPDLSPIRVRVKPSGDGGSGTKAFRHCIHCGARTPSHARFCQVCGNSQT